MSTIYTLNKLGIIHHKSDDPINLKYPLSIESTLVDNTHKTGRIGIIDSGIGSEYITKNVIIKPGDKEDDNGHGTNIFGIIHQIVPNSIYYIAKVLDEYGKVYMDQLIDAFNWLIEHNVDVINVSLYFRCMEEKKLQTLTNILEICKKKGIQVFLASGNYSPHHLIIQEYLIGINSLKPSISEQWVIKKLVTLVGSCNFITGYSSNFTNNNGVKIYTHGENILSYTIKNPSFHFKYQHYKYLAGIHLIASSGTSQACAVATGLYILSGKNIPKLKTNIKHMSTADKLSQVLKINLNKMVDTKMNKEIDNKKSDNILREMLLFANINYFRKLKFTPDELLFVKKLQDEWKYFRNNLKPISDIVIEINQSEVNDENKKRKIEDISNKSETNKVITLIDYLKEYKSLYNGIYLIDILRGLFSINIQYGSLIILNKYWNHVKNINFNSYKNTVYSDQIDQLKKSMEEHGYEFPFTMKKREFFIEIINLFPYQNISNYLCESYKGFLIDIHDWQFKDDMEIKNLILNKFQINN